jgi:hypothetical protein
VSKPAGEPDAAVAAKMAGYRARALEVARESGMPAPRPKPARVDQPAPPGVSEGTLPEKLAAIRARVAEVEKDNPPKPAWNFWGRTGRPDPLEGDDAVEDGNVTYLGRPDCEGYYRPATRRRQR